MYNVRIFLLLTLAWHLSIGVFWNVLTSKIYFYIFQLKSEIKEKCFVRYTKTNFILINKLVVRKMNSLRKKPAYENQTTDTTEIDLNYLFSSFRWWYSRSSHPEAFCKKVVLRNFAKFTRKHLFQSLFFNNVAGLRPLAQVFSCEFCEIPINTFSAEHLRTTTSGNGLHSKLSLNLPDDFRTAFCRHLWIAGFSVKNKQMR